jgi:hypothetical protein
MHSLISPHDYKTKNFNEQDDFTDEEVNVLKQKLHKDIRTLQTENYFCDPPIFNQQIGLVSFVPSKGATPDPDGFFGMMKVRGNFVNEEDANKKAEELIRNVDSYHEVFHVKVGKPFPITVSTDFSEEVKQIDIRKKTTEIVSQDILDKKKENVQDMKDIKQREKNLMNQSKEAIDGKPMDPYDDYIMNHVRRSQLLWTYKEATDRIKQMKETYLESITKIKELDEKYPDFQNTYKEKYMEARESAGLNEKDQNENSFIKYMNYDITTDWDEISL